MTTTSTIPAMIDALLAAANAHPTFANDPSVYVFDGVKDVASVNKWLIVGATDEASVEGAQDFSSFGAMSRSEDYTVRCIAHYASGGSQKEARDNAYSYLAAIEDILNTDPHVGNLAALAAQVEEITLTQTPPDQAGNGRSATVTFTIHVQNRLVN